jgi:hypothetical protein
VNHLGDNFYVIPGTAMTTMTTKQFQETLLVTEGSIIARGQLWDIKGESLGAGVYRVTLKERK